MDQVGQVIAAGTATSGSSCVYYSRVIYTCQLGLRRHPPILVTSHTVVLAITLCVAPIYMESVFHCRPHQVRSRIQDRTIIIGDKPDGLYRFL
jgi:hypothetical protein